MLFAVLVLLGQRKRVTIFMYYTLLSVNSQLEERLPDSDIFRRFLIRFQNKVRGAFKY